MNAIRFRKCAKSNIVCLTSTNTSVIIFKTTHKGKKLMSLTTTAPRTVQRATNPFAPLAKLKNQQLTSTGSPYDPLLNRIQPLISDQQIIDSVEILLAKLRGQVFMQHHFGELKEIWLSDIDINIDIQRFLERAHIAKNIIELFDPRILQPINVVYIKSTGRYSAWDGQQSSATVALLQHFGLIDSNVKIQVKVFDDDLTVPGSTLQGGAVGNYAFRCLNGQGRKLVDTYFVHRSRVNGVRLYNSTLTEDQQSEEIQTILEENSMFPAPAQDAQGQKATPGMVTHISAVNQIAGHGTDPTLFKVTSKDLDWALRWHNTYFNSEKGVDGGFVLAFGRLHAESRGRDANNTQAVIPAVDITAQLEQGLAQMITELYLNPKGFHANCKERLAKWQIANGMRSSWSDSCLAPFLVLDYVTWGKCSAPIPQVPGLAMYSGI